MTRTDSDTDDVDHTHNADFDPIEFLEVFLDRPSHEAVDASREYLLDTLREHATGDGVDASVDDAGNVLATAGDPTGAGTHAVLNTHLDTVSPHVPTERDGDVIRGRGACDAGGPLAALLAAFLAVESDLDPNSTPDSGGADEAPAADTGAVTLAVTPDEETLSRGAHRLVTGDDGDPVPAIATADAFVVGEPTDLAVCTAAKGRFQGTLALTGEHAHAAEPDAGANAVAALEHALAAVRSYDDRPGAVDAHAQLGAPTLTPTVVAGGDTANQVPAEATVVLDRRSVPPETASAFATALRSHVREYVHERASAAVGVDFAFEDRETPFLEAWATGESESVVRAFHSAGASGPEPFGAATEASYFASLAPTVVFGPGVLADDDGAVAHAPREYVHASDVTRAAAIATDALQSLLAN